MNPTKVSILGPDKVALNIPYTLSINPDDNYQFFKETGRERIKKATNHMVYLLRQYPNIKMSLTIDVSRAGRVHWHGTIIFVHYDNIKDFYLEYIHSILEHHTVEIDTIKDIEVWNKYCNKTIHLYNVTVSTVDIMRKRLLTNHPTVIKYKTIDCWSLDTLEPISRPNIPMPESEEF